MAIATDLLVQEQVDAVQQQVDAWQQKVDAGEAPHAPLEEDDDEVSPALLC